jgi:hypothetical protein
MEVSPFPDPVPDLWDGIFMAAMLPVAKSMSSMFLAEYLGHIAFCSAKNLSIWWRG